MALYRIVILRRTNFGFYADSFRDMLFDIKENAASTAQKLMEDELRDLEDNNGDSSFSTHIDLKQQTYSIYKGKAFQSVMVFKVSVHPVTSDKDISKTSFWNTLYRGYKISHNREEDCLEVKKDKKILSVKKDINSAFLFIDNYIMATGV